MNTQTMYTERKQNLSVQNMTKIIRSRYPASAHLKLPHIPGSMNGHGMYCLLFMTKKDEVCTVKICLSSVLHCSRDSGKCLKCSS